jgi:hypothetical protein
MAIILRGKTECSLCSIVIKDGDDIVATSPFIDDQNDLLYRFSDSAMHKSCFLDWDQRFNFVKKYNDAHRTVTRGDGTYNHMEDDGDIPVLKK